MKAILFTLYFFLCLSSFGKTAPIFQGEILGGEKTSLRKFLKEDRALFLTFWASWCTPCLEELQQVRKYLKKHPNFPLDVLTVNVDTSETATDVVPTVRIYGIRFPVIMDPKHQIFDKFRSSKELPLSVLISSTGKIEKVFNGYNENLFSEIQNTLKHLNIIKSSNPQ